ncbi:major facilitator superfamily domain-containing protein [Boeremia exigua]|uniref:major facilitator superfamily domain-containing protein n=1 Tax=Boeremia exigua TaxID=749465 RepID=UPI001E8DAB78|nr:major facilitator superfamily domain-containing protein [Boeremia exigua]KAH6642143.1 major facilitator superfamily domain-containing protein [Boeremia exigua]
MGLGVLEDRHMAAPPGTSTIGASAVAEDPSVDSSELKRDGDIILQPQPSDSPNDPLNWPKMRKEVIMVVLAFSSGVTTSLGPMVTPGLHLIALKYHVSIDMVASLVIGFLAFWIGFTTFFTAAGANIYGKRPFFIVSTVLLLATNIWGYFTTSFASLAVMRVIQGIASAPLETLVTSTVSDMYYVHQRGARISIWGCMLASGVLLGQTIAGVIIEKISFEATFGISALIFIPILAAMYFLVVETTYYGVRPGSQKELEPEEKGSIWSDFTEDKETYRQQLALFRGRLSTESFWRNVWKPVPLIAYPAVLFSTVVYGTYFTWLLTISVLSVSIFSAPPYSLGPAQIGLTNLPLLVVGLIGSPLSGWAADAIAKFMARRNNGIFEPEFRLTLMLPAVIFATIGFLGFGISAQRGDSIYQLVAFMSVHSFSVPFASTASLTYVIDCHPKDANQAFVTINFTKAVLTFVATTYANGVMASIGPMKVFVAITLINASVCAMTIPAYVFGKRFRGVLARSSFGQKIST